MRKKNSIINAIAGILTKFTGLLLGFICRTVFIRRLGYDYLGIYGLFSNILMFLSLSELGVGTSIIYLLYKADVENDTYKKNCLLTFYARVYHIIGCFIILAGIVVMPILPWLIKENVFAIAYLQRVFFLQVLNAAVSYFFSYRSSLIFIKQKDYLLKFISFVCNLLCNTMQIVLLNIHADYCEYLIIQLLFTILNNIVIFSLSKRMYPEVKIGKEFQVDKDTYRNIKTKVFAMLHHKISGFVTNGTDNIIISKLIGIIEVGIYSNYFVIISGISGMLDAAMKGVTASLGNYMTQSTNDEVYKVYKKMDFAFYVINAFCTTCLGVLLHTIIILWLGQESAFPGYIESIIVANFYIMIQKKAIFTLRDVGGLFSNDKNAAIVKPIINLIMSLTLGYSVGIVGVFIGTLISSVVVDVFWMPYMVYKIYFQRDFREYVADYFKKSGIMVLNIIVLSILCPYIAGNNLNIFQLFADGFICCLMTMFIIYIFFRSELKLYASEIKKIIYER